MFWFCSNVNDPWTDIKACLKRSDPILKIFFFLKISKHLLLFQQLESSLRAAYPDRVKAEITSIKWSPTHATFWTQQHSNNIFNLQHLASFSINRTFYPDFAYIQYVGNSWCSASSVNIIITVEVIHYVFVIYLWT